MKCWSNMEVKILKSLPEEASSLSNLLINQSRDPENWAQFLRFPRIRAAIGKKREREKKKRNHSYKSIQIKIMPVLSFEEGSSRIDSSSLIIDALGLNLNNVSDG